MVEVKKETIFQKLKTEIIPIKVNEFIDISHEIMLRKAEGHDVSTSINALSSCFRDDYMIEELVENGFVDNWQEKASEIYKKLVKSKQEDFRKSIYKKFESKEMEFKDPKPEDERHDFVKNKVNIKDIVIPTRYKDVLPSGYKIEKVYSYYKKHNDFPTYIVLDSNNVLLSGYPVYLICKMIDMDQILCYNSVTICPK